MDSTQTIDLDGATLVVAGSLEGPGDEETAEFLDALMDEFVSVIYSRKAFIEACFYDSPEGTTQPIKSEDGVVHLNPGVFNYSLELRSERLVQPHAKQILNRIVEAADPCIARKASELHRQTDEDVVPRWFHGLDPLEA